MIFLGWLAMAGGVLFMWAAIRNLSVVCIVTHAIRGQSADCSNGASAATTSSNSPVATTSSNPPVANDTNNAPTNGQTVLGPGPNAHTIQ